MMLLVEFELVCALFFSLSLPLSRPPYILLPFPFLFSLMLYVFVSFDIVCICIAHMWPAWEMAWIYTYFYSSITIAYLLAHVLRRLPSPLTLSLSFSLLPFPSTSLPISLSLRRCFTTLFPRLFGRREICIWLLSLLWAEEYKRRLSHHSEKLFN